MKNSLITKITLISVLLMLFVSMTPAFSEDYLRSLPRDTNAIPAASGSALKTWWDDTATDGTFNEVLLPTGTECKSVLIQVVSASTTNYEPIAFHYSSTGTSDTGWVVAPECGIIINVGKTSGSLGFVRADSGYKVAILVLY